MTLYILHDYLYKNKVYRDKLLELISKFNKFFIIKIIKENGVSMYH